MVGIISGNSLGLDLGSLATLGSRGLFGFASNGRSSEQVFVNAATGNLVLQSRDEFVASRESDVLSLRTYNSLGQWTDDNGDNWSTGIYAQQMRLVGTINTTGSSLVRTGRDGAQATYAWDALQNKYVSSDGAGAHDTIEYLDASNQYLWREGTSHLEEKYSASNGRLLSSTDPFGNTLWYTYDSSSGLLTKVADKSGETVWYDYVGTQLRGVRTETKNGSDVVTQTRVTYAYDASGRLSEVRVDLTPEDGSTADGKVYKTTYTYDGTSTRVASVTQSDGSSLAFTYEQSEGQYKVKTITDALGAVTTFRYVPGSRQTGVTGPDGRETLFDYDPAGQLLKVTPPPAGGVWTSTSYSYDAAGNVTQIVDGMGQAVTMEYDGRGNLILQRDAAGNTVTRLYTDENLLKTETCYVDADPDGAAAGAAGSPKTTRYVYGSSNPNQLRFVLSANGEVTEFRYNSYGEKISTIKYAVARYDPTGLGQTNVPTEAQLVSWSGTQDLTKTRREDIGYDFRGQIWAIDTYEKTLADGTGDIDVRSRTQYVYDAFGRRLKTIEPGGFTTEYTYDGVGRLLTIKDALDGLTSTVYDDAGAKLTIKHASGRASVSTFDKAGHLLTVSQTSPTNQAMGTTRYAYDAAGRLLMATDPTGVKTWSLYDEAGRKAADIDGTGSMTEYRYNKNGLVTMTIARAGAVDTALLVDANGGPANPSVAAVRPVVSEADSKSWRAYDAANRVVKSVAPGGALTEYVYDGAGRLIQTTQYATLLAPLGSLASSPEPADLVVTASVDDRIERLFYSNDGRLAGRLDAKGYLTTYQYDWGGRQTGQARYATVTSAALRATGTLLELTPGTAVADQRIVYFYDNRDQVIGVIDAENYLTRTAYSARGLAISVTRYATQLAGIIIASADLDSITPIAAAGNRISTRSYDELGRLTWETNFEGTSTDYVYDASGNLISKTEAVGQSVERTRAARFDSLGRVISELSPEGQALLTITMTQAEIDAVWAAHGADYTYDLAGRRTSITDANGFKTRFYYDADGRLTHTINPLGEVQEHQYNELGQLTATIRYATRISAAALSGLSGGLKNATLTNAIKVDAENDSTVSYGYELSGNVDYIADALGNKDWYSYDAFGDVISQSIAMGNGAWRKDEFEYDTRGQRTESVLDVEGIAAAGKATYDAFGRAVTTTDANGNLRSTAYDRLGRITKITDPLLKYRQTTYDAFDRVLTQTDELLQVTKYAYDDVARSVTVTTPENVTLKTMRNRLGQVASVTDGNGVVTWYTYDRNGNLVKTARAGIETTQDFDIAGRLMQTVDGRGIKVAYTYDAASRMFTRRVDPDNTATSYNGLALTTTYTYDGKGQTLTVKDERSITTSFSYDSKGQTLTRVVNMGGLDLTTTFSYDAKGNQLSVTDAEGVLTKYAYDKLGRRTKEQVAPNGLNLTTSYTYDQNSNVVTKTDPRGTLTRYAYNKKDQLTYTVDGVGSITKMEYDAAGRLTRTTRYANRIIAADLSVLPVPATDLQIAAKIVAAAGSDAVEARRYDKDGRMTYTVDGTGAVVKYIYDDSGNVAERLAYANRIVLATWNPSTDPVPTVDAAHDQKTRTTYDSQNRAVYTVDGAGAVTKRAYDGNGNLKTLTRYRNPIGSTVEPSDVLSDATIDRVTRFAYDAANRLTHTADAAGYVTVIAYNGSGDVVSRTQCANGVWDSQDISTVQTSINDRIWRYEYDAAHRTTWQSNPLGAATEFTYDKSGNVTQRREYATPVPGALPSTAVNRKTGNDRITRMTYDAANRLVYSVDALGYVTKYGYDGQGNVTSTRAHITAIAADADPSTVGSLPGDRATSSFYDAAGQVLTSTDALNQTESCTYDGVGNRRTFTNKNDQVWTYTYNAAGRLLTEKSPAVLLSTATVDADGDVIWANGTTPVAILTEMTYDGLGNLLTRTEAKGRPEQRLTSYDYDARGLQIKVTYPAVNVYNESSDVMAANTGLGESARRETVLTPVTMTYYNAFCEAVSAVDRRGAKSFKTYDDAGRLRFEVDALGYVTGYERNGFGEATGVRRYAAATRLQTSAADKAPTSAEVLAVVDAAGIDHDDDRAIWTSFDKMGRIESVTEPYSYTFEAASGTYKSAARETWKIYNAFGDLIRTATKLDEDANLWVYDHRYYDVRGQETASVDAMGYLTKRSYDPVGNLLSVTEFADALTSAWNTNSYGTPTASARDRTTEYNYDKNNRKLSEKRLNVTFSTAADGTSTGGDLTTWTAYDAVGNVIWTSDASGAKTYTYYDALGRIRAVAAPPRSSSVDGASLIPLVAYFRDAHGNVLAKREYTSTATGVTSAGYTVADSSNDRITRTRFDVSGNATHVDDALGINHYNSYRIDSKLAKSWQTATDVDGDAKTLYMAYEYDALGRLLNTYTPGVSNGSRKALNLQYNGFGEVIKRGINGGWQESFEYNRDGRLWKTNADDGNVRIFLYDLLGRRTAEIQSAGVGRGDVDLSATMSQANASVLTSVRRTNIKYDKLGRVIAKYEPERLVIEGGVTIRVATAGAVIKSSNTPSVDPRPNAEKPLWSGTENQVQLNWTDLSYLGSGEVRVALHHDTKGSAGATVISRIEEQIFRGDLAKTGVLMKWSDDVADSSLGVAGVGAVTRMRVYKKNVDGDWILVADRSTWGNYGTIVEAGAPLDLRTTLSFKYRKLGTTSWIVAPMVNFGDSYRFDGSALPAGEYEYQVYMKPYDEASVLTDAGSFKTGVAEVDAVADKVWDRPIVNYKVDRWGNMIERSDPRNVTWKTVCTYNANNQVITEQKPDAAGDQSGSSPITRIYYDKLGRQIATKDARNYVNGTLWDAAGNLIEEKHADGGRITYAYNVFGERVRTIDALGNQSGAAAATISDHTTLYAYDKLGRLLTATHGNTAAGSVRVSAMSTTMAFVLGTMRNLVETSTYDEVGRKKTQTNTAGELTSYKYDLAGQLVQVEQPLGRATSYTYDNYGNKLSEKDANGNSATWAYSATDARNYFHKVTGHTDLGGAAYTYTYDNAGQLTAQTNTRGQNLSYGYDAAGQLVRVTDAALGETSSYVYDLAGRHLREKVVRNGEFFQDNHLAYDTLGRLRIVADNRLNITMEYDAAENRTRVKTSVWVAQPGTFGNDEVDHNEDRYFLYDSMNRQRVVDAVDSAGTLGTQGHRITYDLSGNRLTDTFTGNQVTGAPAITYYDTNGRAVYATTNPVYKTATGTVIEVYGYDALDRLKSIERDGVQVDLRFYDAAGRVIQSGTDGHLPTGYAAALNQGLSAQDSVGLETRQYRYEAGGGRLAYQQVSKSDNTLKYELDYTAAGSYDAAGNVLKYTFKNFDGDDYTSTYTHTLAKYETYVQKTATVARTGYANGVTTSSYDANGYLVGIDDSAENTFDRSFVNDASGRVLRSLQAGNALRNVIANGEVLGRHGVGVNEVDPHNARSNDANFASIAEFDFGYRPITAGYPGAALGQYEVRSGDTLKAIAQAAWGDSSAWWRIAEANGLRGDSDLRVGQTLSIPNHVPSANSAGSFQPYDPSRIVGDTSPNLPAPKADAGCGAVGQIIMIVVAVAITVYTAGAAAEALGVVMTEVTASSVAVAAGAAAVGSVASQTVGMAIGAQKEFNWNAVALAAISAGVTQGVAPGSITGEFKGATDVVSAMGRAAVSNAATQGIAMATGLQEQFSWRSVAAAAAGAGVGHEVGGAVSDALSGTGMDASLQKIVAGTAGGFAGGVTATVMKGGRVVAAQIAADAFGQALGQGLVDQMNRPGQSEAVSMPDANTRIDNRMPSIQTDEIFDQLVELMENPVGADRSQDVVLADASATRKGNYPGPWKDSTLNGVPIQTRETGPHDWDERPIPDDTQQVVVIGRRVSEAPTTSTLAGSGEIDSSLLYQQGLGDIRETITSIVVNSESLDTVDSFSPIETGSVRQLTGAESFFTFNPAGQVISGVGEGAAALLTAPVTLVTEAALAVSDTMGQSVYAAMNWIGNDGVAYQPDSALFQSVRRQGVAGTVGAAITGTVQGLVAPIDALYRQDLVALGRSLPGTALAVATSGWVARSSGLGLTPSVGATATAVSPHPLQGWTPAEVIRHAQTLGLQTARDEALLWSGFGRDSQGALRSRLYAEQHGGRTIEMTSGGAWLNEMNLDGDASPFTRSQVAEIWRETSRSFTRGASGQVRAVLGAVKPDSIYSTIEVPELRINPNVTGVDELYLHPRYPFLSE
jgi:YD repeat-containing protein